MQLWLLNARRDLNENDNPWEPWYDKTFTFVIRAASEDEARKIADENAGPENRDGDHPWLSSSYATCVELTSDGEPGVICEDAREA